MQEEINSIHKNDTWETVDLPPGKVPVTTKWVYKLKQKDDDSFNKLKARLGVRGLQQQQGIDFDETFAPVVKWGTIRTLFALAAQQSGELYHMDIKTAFLNGDLREEFYIEQPDGFQIPPHQQKVCKLKKALYGLKQAPRAWYEKVDHYLRIKDYKRRKWP